jgi:hypothetical protein
VGRNFNYNLIEIKAQIRIFDRNENNLSILNISDSIQTGINKLFNISFEDFTVIGVYISGNELKLYNEINSVWSDTLNIKLVAKQTF